MRLVLVAESKVIETEELKADEVLDLQGVEVFGDFLDKVGADDEKKIREKSIKDSNLAGVSLFKGREFG